MTYPGLTRPADGQETQTDMPPSDRQETGSRPSPRQVAAQRRQGRHGRRLRMPKADLLSLALVALAALGVILGWRVAAHATEALGLGFLALAGLMGVCRLFWGAGCAATAGLVLLLPAFLPSAPAAQAAGCRFSVLSFNTKLTRAAIEDEVATLLARHAADVLLLQEVVRPDALRATLLAHPVFARHTVISDPRTPDMIVSRFPLRPSPEAWGVHTALAEIGGQTLRLVTGVRPKEFLENTGSIELAGLFDRMLTRGGYPVVVGMDLNAGPRSALVHDLTRQLEDSHARAGAGLGFTFPTPARQMGLLGSWLRIDYILHGRRLRTVDATVIREAAGSTHFPVRATIALAEGGAAGAPC